MRTQKLFSALFFYLSLSIALLKINSVYLHVKFFHALIAFKSGRTLPSENMVERSKSLRMYGVLLDKNNHPLETVSTLFIDQTGQMYKKYYLPTIKWLAQADTWSQWKYHLIELNIASNNSSSNKKRRRRCSVNSEWNFFLSVWIKNHKQTETQCQKMGNLNKDLKHIQYFVASRKRYDHCW